MNLKALILKFFRLINIPGHLKRIYLKMKIKHHKENKSIGIAEKISDLLNSLILILFIAGVIYLNYLYRDLYLLGMSFLLIAIVFYIIRRKTENEAVSDAREISELVLKDPDNKNIQNWDITGAVSLILGKESSSNDVDIDLSNAIYSSLISRHHAVMNNTGDKWYFEDIGSQNGSGIKKRNSKNKFKVQKGQPYQINAGDVIYIANTKILIK